ncbi:hypothetical protein AB0F91_14705 [Amycolatopsis sp. NPDC023774]|uniref:hypothetical protein n=1 Tax=Amycolatopsis sp. NPDC023774 TaxID=3155015 RepID=UPI00340699AD
MCRADSGFGPRSIAAENSWVRVVVDEHHVDDAAVAGRDGRPLETVVGTWIPLLYWQCEPLAAGAATREPTSPERPALEMSPHVDPHRAAMS